MNSFTRSVDLLHRAMDASTLRYEVSANNLANSEVPNFKRTSVNFESQLKRALESEKNAGDAFHSPDSLSEIAVAAEANGFPDVVYGQTQLVDASRKFVAMRHLSAPEHLTFESFRQGMLVCHQAFVVKREIAEPYDLRYRFSADYEWCLRCLKKMKGSAYTGTVIIDYLTDGLTDKNHMASLKERFPEADFLLTTPPGSYWRKRVKKTLKNGRKTYVTRHILNEQVEQVAQTQVA